MLLISSPQEVKIVIASNFQTQLVLGCVACLLCVGTYILPRLRSMDRFNAQRVIATIHSFRFFGLVFILPGVVGPKLPADFAVFAAYGDFATGLLALLALLMVRIRPLFWFFVAPSTSWARPTSSLTTTTPLGWAVRMWQASWAPRDPHNPRPYADDHARDCLLLAGASSVQGSSSHCRQCGRLRLNHSLLSRILIKSRDDRHEHESVRAI